MHVTSKCSPAAFQVSLKWVTQNCSWAIMENSLFSQKHSVVEEHWNFLDSSKNPPSSWLEWLSTELLITWISLVVCPSRLCKNPQQQKSIYAYCNLYNFNHLLCFSYSNFVFNFYHFVIKDLSVGYIFKELVSKKDKNTNSRIQFSYLELLNLYAKHDFFNDLIFAGILFPNGTYKND